jgi:DNA-binding response OmpR family regulator
MKSQLLWQEDPLRMHVAMPRGGPLQWQSGQPRDLNRLQKNLGLEETIATERICSCQHEPTEETAPPETESLPSGMVLLVSYDELLRAILRAYLEHVGKRVRCCTDAARVSELFVRGAGLDLLVVDVPLAGAPELRLAAELTAQFPDLRVIVLCADPATKTKIAAGCPEGWRLVSRPMVLPDLLGLIRGALEKHAELRSARMAAPRGEDVCSSRGFETAGARAYPAISCPDKRDRSEVGSLAADGLQP